MNHLPHFGRLSAMSGVLNAEQARPAGAAKGALPPPIIAISRQAGSNASAVARAVGERLGWPVFDRELINKIAEEVKLDSEAVEPHDEHRGSWLTEFLESFSSKVGFNEIAYVRRLRPVLHALASRGECVIVGRGAAQALPAATTLRVRLAGPLDGRIAAVQQRFAATPAEARRRVLETDYHRARFVREYFGKDADDPDLYDLNLNVCRLGAEDCAEIIVTALNSIRKPAAVGAGSA